MEASTSEYLFILRESTPEVYEAMSADERRQALDRWNNWCDDLVARGKLRSGNPLMPDARLVSDARDGRAMDGPFAEAKELVGGYFLVAAADLDEATAIAEESPNLPYGMTIEVRPIARACHLARSLGWETMRGPVEV